MQYVAIIVSIVSLFISVLFNLNTAKQTPYSQLVRLTAYRNIAHTATRFIPVKLEKAKAGEFDEDLVASFAAIEAGFKAIDYGQVVPTELVIPFIHISHMIIQTKIIWDGKTRDVQLIQNVMDSTNDSINQIDSYLRSKDVKFESGLAVTPPAPSIWRPY
jgi:hypothetical protein